MNELDDNDVFEDEGSIIAASELLQHVRHLVDDWWNQGSNLTKNLSLTQRTGWLKSLFVQNAYAIDRSIRILGVFPARRA